MCHELQVKYGVLARGDADVYLRLPHVQSGISFGSTYQENIWDHAGVCVSFLHCSTLQRTETHCITLQHTAACWRQHTVIHCNTLNARQ